MKSPDSEGRATEEADKGWVCGILGIAVVGRGEVVESDARVAALRDMMAHRGPDAAGVWRGTGVVLAHRRLAVIAPGPQGEQPMASADGRWVIVYNGELYNDAEVRADLAREGVQVRTRSDTETVLAALSAWGAAGLSRLRGMYALGLYDAREHSLLLARDPLGVKPLYFHASDGPRGRVVFASEPGVVARAEGVGARPDFAVVSAYLTTIRTTLGNRTLFEGVRTLRAGEALKVDLRGPDGPRLDLWRHWRGPTVAAAGDWREDVGRVREVVRESVRVHLRSDVPACSLLSGGLDSTVIAQEMAREVGGEVRTYCSGAAEALGDEGGDFALARLAAGAIGSRHTQAPVRRETFRERVEWMVRRQGVPVSTPNEVAINEVARVLRRQGNVVALSGEGADELFAGYDLVMTKAAEFEAAGGGSGGVHQLTAAAWVPTAVKGVVLTPALWRTLEGDAALVEFYEREFADVKEECGRGAGALEPHQRFQRRINLAGLLQRLDTATALESVEGRTPFADVRVADLAERIPLSHKLDLTMAPAQTKMVLREAFAGDVPAAVLRRPKASFPLPFEAWMHDFAGVLRRSAFAREVFTRDAREMVAADPARHWRLAWPMVNLSLWGDACWG